MHVVSIIILSNNISTINCKRLTIQLVFGFKLSDDGFINFKEKKKILANGKANTTREARSF